MMKRSEKNLILLAIFSLIGFGYQNCAQSNHIAEAEKVDMASTAIPSLGAQVSVKQMANLARVLKSVDSSKPYSVHEIETTGSTLKEYVSNDGIVFAVSWRGISEPDLSQLLGTYFSDYQAERARHSRVHGMRVENTTASQVVVRRAGHMRDLQGQVYDARLFPDGFSAEDIQ